MGELLDSLNGIGRGAIDKSASPLLEPMSMIGEATETIGGRPRATVCRRTAIERVSRWIREAPLQSMAIAFLLGAAFSRRR